MTTPGRKFLIVCGGTGGHLAPGIALAERLTRRGHQCRLILSRKEVDGRLSRKYTQLDFESVPGVALQFSLLGVLRFVFGFAQSIVRAGRLVRAFRPHATIVFGGFLSPPFVVWSRLLGILVAVHESNRRPGRAVRVLARLAHRVFVPNGVHLNGVSRERLSHCGYPLRQEIQPISPPEARKRWGLHNDFKTLVVVGGSQGAMALNDWVNAHFAAIGKDGLNLIVVSGPQKGVESTIELETESGAKVLAWFLPFTDDMSLLLSVADLVISRAGAGAIAELTACCTPSILVPYPFAADQHQDANAQYFAQQGGCLVVPQEGLEARLLEVVKATIFNDALLDQMRERLQTLGVGDQAEALAIELEQSLLDREMGSKSTRSAASDKEVAA